LQKSDILFWSLSEAVSSLLSVYFKTAEYIMVLFSHF